MTVSVMICHQRPNRGFAADLHGSTGEVVAVVKAESPEARLFVNQIGLGSVASRDRMMRAARGDLVMALDGDSHPELD